MAAWDSRYVDVGGIRTHYLEAGRGPTLVLLHSGEFGGCAELSWEHNIGAFAEHCRVIAPDWLGFGRTDKLYDFAQGHRRVLSHMAAFLREMRIYAADFVGNSMGGTFLARVAASPEPLFAQFADTYRNRALRIVAEGVNALRANDRAFLVITHYQRLLDYIKPDKVHVLANGRIVKTAGPELALELEREGYDKYLKAAA